MHETHIVFENLSNINRDMLQKAWGLNIGEDGKNACKNDNMNARQSECMYESE